MTAASNSVKAASELTPLVVHKTSDDGKASNSNVIVVDPKKESVGAYSDVTPDWHEMMGKILPFLRPADWQHTSYAIAALISVLFGKILGVLPPLAIKYAVDAISENNTNNAAGDDTTNQEGQDPNDDDLKELAKPIVNAILVFFGLRVAMMINSAGQDLAQRAVALDAERRFGVATFAHLHSLSLSYHLEKHIGEITRIMNRGVDSISTVISSFLFFLAPTIFEAIVVSAVFWKLGTPMIALSTLLAMAVYLSFTLVITKTRIAYRRKLIEASDDVGQKETETLVNYETVSMFGRTSYEIQQYGTLRQTYKHRRVEMLGMFALLEAGQKFVQLCGISAGLLIAGRATVYGYGEDAESNKLSPGSFVIIQMYIVQLFQPLTQLGWQYRMITQAFTDLEKAVTMLNRVPEVQDGPNAIVWKKPPTSSNLSSSSTSLSSISSPSSRTTSGEIVFHNVSFHYKSRSNQKKSLGSALDKPYKGGLGGNGRHGGRRGRMAAGFVDEGVTSQKKKQNKKSNKDDIDKNDDDEESPSLVKLGGGVEHLSFKIPAGKTAALVGKSGSGKTTIVRLVLRMYDPDEGCVFVDGHNVKSLTQESLRQNIGVVAQETILFNATLRENIVYGKIDATEEEIWNAVRTAALETFVNSLPDKLNTMVGERGMKLSGGERQRVGLARCVIKDPQLILLDEATSALDSATEREIQHNVFDLVCSGRTALMIAHRLSTARHADEIIVLDNGRICERGSHDELLAVPDGNYARMWKIQNGEDSVGGSGGEDSMWDSVLSSDSKDGFKISV